MSDDRTREALERVLDCAGTFEGRVMPEQLALDARLLRAAIYRERGPVGYRHDFTCGHSVFSPWAEWDVAKDGCRWKDEGEYVGAIPLYTEPSHD